MVQPERPQMAMPHAFACWVSKATRASAYTRPHQYTSTDAHTQICNIYCFSTPIISQTRPSVTLYAQCLSCCVLQRVQKDSANQSACYTLRMENLPQEWSDKILKVTNHLLILPKLRMSEATPPFPHMSFLAKWHLDLLLHLYGRGKFRRREKKPQFSPIRTTTPPFSIL